MKAIIGFCASALALAIVGQAATVSTTLTVNAAGSLNSTTLSVTATGTATMTNVFTGTGTFTGSLALSNISGSSVIGSFTITPATGGTITGTLTLPLALLEGLLEGTTTTGTGSAAVTGGTGSYAGYTGSIPALAGSGSPTPAAGGFSLTMTGNGTIATSGGGTSTPTPAITSLQNNFSYILPGLPNYGIAPGSLFIIKGSNLNNQALSSLQSSSATGGLPLTLNGTSVSVTVNGTTTQPFIYYTSPSQLGVVLPSTTPAGTGTITVTNSGQASAPAPIQVVASAFGIDTLYGTGTGQGVANDPNFNFLLPGNSASPGETINLWGSGVGADTKNTNEGTYPLNEDNLTNIPMQVYIGGVSATITYRGRSQYPGVDQVQVVVPTGITTGCFVSVVAVSGNVVSNTVTIPVATGGGACTDLNVGIGAGTASSLSGLGSVNFGFLALLQQVSPGATASAAPVTNNLALAEFQTESGAAFGSSSGTSASIGSCVINAATIGTASAFPTLTGLDAGTVTLNGSGGLQTLSTIPTLLGLYEASLPTGYIPSAGGSFTFAGSGGANVGKFNSTVTYPSPLTWTNMSSISAVSRASGQSVTWSGGASGSYVQIVGGSTATAGGQSVSVSFTCQAPASAGQFTVPSYILLSLPAGTGTLGVNNFTNPQTFTATGLNVGYMYAGWSGSINATYN